MVWDTRRGKNSLTDVENAEFEGSRKRVVALRVVSKSATAKASRCGESKKGV
jgi:hypothetical protein